MPSRAFLTMPALQRDLCSYLSAVFKLLKSGNIDRCVSGAENIVETTLRQTACQRHLTAFKTRTDTAAGTGPLALVTAACGLAIAGTSATALRYAGLVAPAAGVNSCSFMGYASSTTSSR